LLEELRYPDARIERKVLVHDDEAVEIKMFCEDPLVVEEATISIESMEEAEKEVEKLLKTRGNCGEEVWEEADARGIIRC